MKLVAVSQRIDNKLERNEKWDALDQNLIRFLFAAGLCGVPIPNSLIAKSPNGKYNDFNLSHFLDILKPNGIVLSGGSDIGEYQERDSTELSLINYARTHTLPLLGICRGMQMMCHVEDVVLQPIQGHAGTRHIVNGKICQEVNSYHHYGITKCPRNYSVLAFDKDSRIEAINHHVLPWEGWMWHPEREKPFNKSDVKRVQAIFGR
jgi:N5-(cytidine 5'-diphosphoramidyl)-L-glutamine hydrolase